MNAAIQSILASEDMFEYDRILDAFTSHSPESAKWVLICLAENKYSSDENKWVFTNIASEYQWMKRKIDRESMATIGKKFSLYKSPRNPYRTDEPSWTINEGVILKLAADGYLKLNDNKTAAYPTDKVYEKLKSKGAPVQIEKTEINEEKSLAYERLIQYTKIIT